MKETRRRSVALVDEQHCENGLFRFTQPKMGHLVSLLSAAIVFVDEDLRFGDDCAASLRKFTFGDRGSKLDLIKRLKTDIARVDDV